MSLLLIWRHSLHYVIGDHGCDEGDHERWLTLMLKVQHHARIDESEWNRDQPGSHVPPVDALPQVPLFFPVYRHLLQVFHRESITCRNRSQSAVQVRKLTVDQNFDLLFLRVNKFVKLFLNLAALTEHAFRYFYCVIARHFSFSSPSSLPVSGEPSAACGMLQRLDTGLQ